MDDYVCDVSYCVISVVFELEQHHLLFSLPDLSLSSLEQRVVLISFTGFDSNVSISFSYKEVIVAIYFVKQGNFSINCSQ